MNADILRIGPSPREARAAVILIHGRGSSAHDMAGLATTIQVPGVCWMLPNAPSGSWYPRRFLEPITENEPSLTESLQTIDNVLTQLTEAGVPSERIGLAGFSQGGCLAAEFAFRNPRRYGFIAALSGALIGPEDAAREPVDLRRSPVLLACADHDTHVPAVHVDITERLLSASNAAITRLRFPGTTHSIFPEELDWIERALERAQQD